MTTQVIVDIVNALSSEETDLGLVLPEEIEDEQDEGNAAGGALPQSTEPLSETGVEQNEDEDSAEQVVVLEEDLEQACEDTASLGGDEENDEQVIPERVSERISAGVKRPERFIVNHLSVKRGVKEYGEAAVDSIRDELRTLFVDKKAMHPVRKENLTLGERKKIIRSFMFLKAKYDGMGEFEKIKARLVANGSQQELKPRIETASPTVAMESVLMCLTVAAKRREMIAIADIGSAYLNAKMTGEAVHMELDATLVNILVKICPHVEDFVDQNGKLIVQLDQALYGCVQSALLWYQTMSDFLTSLGFKANHTDMCVWCKDHQGDQITVLLYVDDLLILSVSDGAIEEFLNDLKVRFMEVKRSREANLSYLGMHIKWGEENENRVTVSMAPYVKNVLQEYNVSGKASSPALSNIFEPEEESAVLGETDRKEFHTIVAKLLYLANRTRPDIMLAIAYLATRVNFATIDDRRKLDRVMKYLNSTSEKALTLRGEGDKLETFIDAAFALHDDAKSHTGMVVKLYGDTVLVKSSKQKIVTRDSTEAELVALSDKILVPIRCREFLNAQGVDIGVPVVYQDNMSTISLVTKGGGKYRNKYIHVRQQDVLQMARDGDVDIRYVRTGDMEADGCTKPLQGNLGRMMAARLLGETGLGPQGCAELPESESRTKEA